MSKLKSPIRVIHTSVDFTWIENPKAKIPGQPSHIPVANPGVTYTRPTPKIRGKAIRKAEKKARHRKDECL